MFTSKFIIRGAKKSLKLRIFLHGKSTELSVPSINVEEEDLKDAMSRSPRQSNLALARNIKEWNAQLSNLQLELVNSKLRSMSLSELRGLIEKELFGVSAQEAERENDKRNWEKFYVKYVESKTNEGYRQSCRYTLNKMREHCKDFSRLTFEDITLKWLNDLDEKLVEDGLSQNSRNIHFKNIRTCLNRAIDEELTTNYPFRRFKIKAEETRKRNLPVEELRRLFDYHVEDYQKYYLDIFKLMFFLVGINGTDLYNLTKIENGRIEYRRAKTHKLYSIKVEPEAMEIIDRHRSQNGDGLLDITDRWKRPNDFLKNMNIALKKIGKMQIVGRGGKKKIKAEWPELSTYWARHSWASIAYNDCRISKDIIAQALGHEMGVGVTEIYLNKDQKLIDRANRRVIDWVLKGER